MKKSSNFGGTRSLNSNKSLTNKHHYFKNDNPQLDLKFFNQKSILQNDSTNNSARTLKTENTFIEMLSTKSSFLSLNNIDETFQTNWINTKKTIIDKEFNNRKLINSWEDKLTNWEEKEQSFSNRSKNSMIFGMDKSTDEITEKRNDKNSPDFLVEELDKENKKEEGESLSSLENEEKEKKKVVKL